VNRNDLYITQRHFSYFFLRKYISMFFFGGIHDYAAVQAKRLITQKLVWKPTMPMQSEERKQVNQAIQGTIDQQHKIIELDTARLVDSQANLLQARDPWVRETLETHIDHLRTVLTLHQERLSKEQERLALSSRMQ